MAAARFLEFEPHVPPPVLKKAADPVLKCSRILDLVAQVVETYGVALA